ncbi:MAG: protease inhibitor I42 family protein [Chloroflexota bacterium]
MKRTHLILILLLLLALAACGKDTTAPASSGGAPTVTDPDQPIEARAGEEFTITVETAGNVSGLHWEVAVELDTAVVDYVWKDFIPKTSNIDGSGWDVWKFKAVAPGATTITLGYYRGATEDATKMAVFTIIVK